MGRMAPPGTPKIHSTPSASSAFTTAFAPVVFSFAMVPLAVPASPAPAVLDASERTLLLLLLLLRADAQRDAVHHVEEGAGAPLDDVGGERAAAVDTGLVLHLQAHLALGVLTHGHRLDAVVAELGLDAGDLLDGLEYRVDRAVAGRGVLEALPARLDERDGGGRQGARAGGGGERLQLPHGLPLEELPVDHQRLQVG